MEDLETGIHRLKAVANAGRLKTGQEKPEKDRATHSLVTREDAMDPQKTNEDQDTRTRDPSTESRWVDMLREDLADESAGPPRGSFPGYELVRELSQGGQGVVYQAIQKSTKRKVAIKVLRGGPDSSSSATKRFEREIELAAQLKHPNIISVFHSGITEDGWPYYVMDYVRGRPLHKYVREKKLSLEETLGVFLRLCEAVHYAHQRGIIHRDLKPSNILVDADGEPRILDFGLGKWIASPLDGTLSVTHDLFGTLPYMSPEQAQGHHDESDARTDVYALGVILYELLTGQHPYPVNGPALEVLKHILETLPGPLRERWLSETGIGRRSESHSRSGSCPLDTEIQTVVFRALAKERGRRYASAEALAQDVRRYLSGEPIEARADDLGYLIRARSRGFLRRQPLLACVAAVFLSVFLAQWIAAPFVLVWTPLDQVFKMCAFSLRPTPLSATEFKHVAILELTDSTLKALAEYEGLKEYTSKKKKSLRPLHGRLMERLAEWGVRGVAWCLEFEGDDEGFDIEFLAGVRALRKNGIHTVVGVPNWLLDGAAPKLSKAIAAETHSGCMTLKSDSASWEVFVAALRGADAPLLSFSLQALAMERQAGLDWDLYVDFHRLTEELYLSYGPKELRRSVQIPLTSVEQLGEELNRFGLTDGDWVAVCNLEVPSDEALKLATHPYEYAFQTDTIDDLRISLKDKVVIIGDGREKEDVRRFPGGRDLPVFKAHAAFTEILLQNVEKKGPGFVQRPLSSETWWLLLGAAVVGVGLGYASGLLVWRRILFLGILVAALIGLSLGAVVQANYECNPLIPAASLVMAAELAALVRRTRGRSPRIALVGSHS